MGRVRHQPRLLRESDAGLAIELEREKHRPLLGFQGLRGAPQLPGQGFASGGVWIGETYFKETKSGLILHDGKRPRGLSRNLYCAATARDAKGDTALIPCGRGKPDAARILTALGPHIEEGSKVIHDGENSHSRLISELRCAEEIHPTSQTKGLPDYKNPMDAINEVHRFLKKFMACHGGASKGTTWPTG